MEDFIFLMWKPLLTCLILTGIHAYLGIHIIERQVIFVDLSLAQIAAMGASLALLFSFPLHSPQTYWFSLSATVIGALLFALSRTRSGKIPQEAIIGIIYAVSAALAILILSRTADGDEEIRHMLVGNILLVDLRTILKMAVLYSVIGLLHWRFHSVFNLISTDYAGALKQGVQVRKWDFLFYLTFGIVVTSSVDIAGVLLVFSYLIVPAASAILFTSKFRHKLVIGWCLGLLVSVIGISSSYVFDLPTGAAVIGCFGLIFILMIFLARILRK